MSQGIEGPAFDEAFHNPFVHPPQIHTATEIQKRLEFPPATPSLDYGLHCADAYIFHRRQAEADVSFRNGEVASGFVDIWRQHTDTHLLAAVDVTDDLVAIILFAGKEGRHEFFGIMGLQIGGLIGNHGIGGAVGLVETVLGEFLHLLPYPNRLVLGNVILFRPGNEFGHLLFHFLVFLLAHDLTQRIRLRHGVPSDGAGDLHDLFLIKDHSVGFLKNIL